MRFPIKTRAGSLFSNADATAFSSMGEIEKLIMCNGTFLRAGDRIIRLREKADFAEH